MKLNITRSFRASSVARLCVLFLGPLATLVAADTATFRQRLLADLGAGLERVHTAADTERSRNAKPADYYYPYVLWGYVHLHRATDDPRLLAWAKGDLLWLVRSAKDANGQPMPFFTGFRLLPPFVDAFLYLKDRGQLSAGESAEVEAQIRTLLADRLHVTDYGPQNRAVIRGAEFLYGARAMPDAAEAAEWRRRGEALVYDSLHGWPMEDASIYQPFWFNYVLTLEEMRGTAETHLRSPQARFEFEFMKQLLLPNGFMPEWGDGEWSQSWMWFVADLVRGGSFLRDGEYLEAARRIYDANLAFDGGALGAEAVGAIGLALHWLDANVPLQPLDQTRSHEVVDDVIAKKLMFRSPGGAAVFLNYRDEGPGNRFARDYLNAQLYAQEEKPHHGHADEMAINALMDAGTVLLWDGGYRRTFADGWRADVFHNRVVARTGQPQKADPFDYVLGDLAYHPVQTEKIHFGTFGSLDYSRTRLIDEERGYTGDRIVVFAPENALTLVIDSIVIDRPGTKIFANTWHPENILQQGDGYVVSWPKSINDRHASWPNPHARDLLIQFLDNRDKIAGTREVDRRFRPSQVFYQYLKNHFFKGQRLTFVTVLRPHAAGKFAAAMLADVRLLKDDHDDGRTLGLQFTLGGERVIVGLKLDQTIGLTNLRGRPMFDYGTGAVNYGPLHTDAEFAFVRTRRDGGSEFGFINAIGVEHDGRTLFAMPPNPEMYQGPGNFRVADVRDKMPRWHEVVPK